MLKVPNARLQQLLVCPCCKQPGLSSAQHHIACGNCGETYVTIDDTPVLIKKNSPVFEFFEPEMHSVPSPSTSVRARAARIVDWLTPEDRIWTTNSQQIIERIVKKVSPHSVDGNIVLIGAGFEPVFQRVLGSRHDVMRVGLTSRGEVDVFGDVCNLPLADDSADLVLSSSVMEHVYDPEAAVQEMYRIVKPGGQVYAEIPFMRAYHMEPIDYQRYTISGIEELFKRHGFELVDKGVCSGPFTAISLFSVDFFRSAFSFNRYLKVAVQLVLSLLMHPV